MQGKHGSEGQPREKSYRVGCVTDPLIDATIGDALAAIAAAHPASLALSVLHQGIRWNWHEYDAQVSNFAVGLARQGIRAGDRVGIWSPNRVEWCLTQFATARIGAILVCINPAYRAHELSYVLAKSGCRCLILAPEFRDQNYLSYLREVVPELSASVPGSINAADFPDLRLVVLMSDADASGCARFSELSASAVEVDLREIASSASRLRPDDAINIQFTSGTTGAPKGATLTHRNILNNGRFVGQAMRLTPIDRLCVPVPLYHCFGMVLGGLAAMVHGAAVVLPSEGFDPAATLSAVEAEGCTAIHGVPTMFIAELGLEDFDQYDLSSLRTGIMAGAPCPIEVMREVTMTMGVRELLIAYGQTETSPVNLMTAHDDPIEKRVSTVGRVGPHLEIKLVDEHDRTVAIGERGEICCRGYSVMRGYWQESELTAATIGADGWLRSGDQGVMDQDGYVTVTGRLKDVIIRGGENIYPAEIESFLHTHPGIAAAQVFGIPDQRLGEIAVAWVQPKTLGELSEEEIRSFCQARIARFKVPAHIRVVETFPMTVTGKPQKFLMRQTELARIDS